MKLQLLHSHLLNNKYLLLSKLPENVSAKQGENWSIMSDTLKSPTI